MDDLELFPSLPSRQTMTVKEVADALGYESDTIRKKAKELFPAVVENGKMTLLNEEQVFEIKKSLTPRTLALKSEVDGALSALEINEMTLKVIHYHVAENSRLQAELAAAAPKIALADAIGRSNLQMSITDASKHFSLHPIKEVFPYLRDAGYLTARDLPTQAAIDAGYLALKETMSQDGRMFQQAVVETWQLENWRAHVVHQVKRWNQAIKPLKAR